MINVQVKLGIDIRKIHDFLINEEFITLEVKIFSQTSPITMIGAIFITIDTVLTTTITNGDSPSSGLRCEAVSFLVWMT